MRIVDTKGMLCPAPLIETKRALKETEVGGSFKVLTDNKTSCENLRRFLKDNTAEFKVSESDGVWTLRIKKTSGEKMKPDAEDYCFPAINHFEKGDYVVAISSDKMGDGDEDLGHLLILNFIKALKDLEKLPRHIVFYNKGVLLVKNDSPVSDHIRDLEKMGVEIHLCATCVNHYELENKTAAGTLSNMYSIAELMAAADSIIKP